jgi:hypothetical protein
MATVTHHSIGPFNRSPRPRPPWPYFLALYPYFLKYGGVFKLCFGPKVFMVLSDPVVVR